MISKQLKFTRGHKPGENLCGGMNLAKNSSDISR
nr:MAG TPA: hypothetical protein [Caudoviricetes sp.]